MIPKKIFSPYAVTIAVNVLCIASVAIPIFAQTSRPNRPRLSPPPVKDPPTIIEEPHNTVIQTTRRIERSDKEIDQRITRLNTLSSRLQTMKKISDTTKTGLLNTIKTEITDLTNLKTKIAAETDMQTLRADMQSITKAYRIYALIMPQIAILAAADRVTTISDALTQVAQKLQTRIDAAQTAGNDVTTLAKSLADMNAKIADAKAQAAVASSQIQNLKPDNGDDAMLKANTQALKDAHAKIKTAMKDLVDARKTAHTIITTLRTLAKPSGSAIPSPSASPSASPTSTQ